MENKKNSSIKVGSYRTFFEKSSEIVKKISNSFIYDPGSVNPETNIIWDKKVSTEIEELFLESELSQHYHFYSEEKPGKSLTPPIFLIDPIDGSREFLLNIPECAVCLSFIEDWSLKNFEQGAHLIWNFRTNSRALMLVGEVVLLEGSTRLSWKKEALCKGLVSRREWDEGYFKKAIPNLDLKPVGSIANKLSLLALGQCDFVYSGSDKNIWDIAAGSFILTQLGYAMYGPGGRIKELGSSPLKGPLLWCKESDYERLSKELSL